MPAVGMGNPRASAAVMHLQVVVALVLLVASAAHAGDVDVAAHHSRRVQLVGSARVITAAGRIQPQLLLSQHGLVRPGGALAFRLAAELRGLAGPVDDAVRRRFRTFGDACAFSHRIQAFHRTVPDLHARSAPFIVGRQRQRAGASERGIVAAGELPKRKQHGIRPAHAIDAKLDAVVAFVFRIADAPVEIHLVVVVVNARQQLGQHQHVAFRGRGILSLRECRACARKGKQAGERECDEGSPVIHVRSPGP